MSALIRCSFTKGKQVLRAKVKLKVRAYSLTFHTERSQDLVEQRAVIYIRILRCCLSS